MRRQPSRRGLSYFDANSGRLVTEGPDVLNVKAEIESRWKGVLSVYFDVHQEEWVIVEKSVDDDTERFVLSTKALSMKTVERLQKMDQATHDVGDLAAKFEREDAQAERDREHRLSEVIGEPIERLEHALLGSGVMGINRLIVADGEYIKPGKKTIKAAG